MKLQEFLKLNPLSLKDAARVLGITRAHLYLLRIGKRVPSPQLAIRIEKFSKGKISRYELRSDAEKIWGPNVRS